MCNEIPLGSLQFVHIPPTSLAPANTNATEKAELIGSLDRKRDFDHSTTLLGQIPLSQRVAISLLTTGQDTLFPTWKLPHSNIENTRTN